MYSCRSDSQHMLTNPACTKVCTRAHTDTLSVINERAYTAQHSVIHTRAHTDNLSVIHTRAHTDTLFVINTQAHTAHRVGISLCSCNLRIVAIKSLYSLMNTRVNSRLKSKSKSIWRNRVLISVETAIRERMWQNGQKPHLRKYTRNILLIFVETAKEREDVAKWYGQNTFFGGGKSEPRARAHQTENMRALVKIRIYKSFLPCGIEQKDCTLVKTWRGGRRHVQADGNWAQTHSDNNVSLFQTLLICECC